jgi:uncharacterized protein YndB with AHSA1/START domain
MSYDVVSTRVFAESVDEVWRAWSEPAYVMRWWGPTGFTCPLAEMDFRDGGTSLVCMRTPVEYGGQDIYTTWSYSRIEPRKRIEFVLDFTDAARAPIDPPPGVPRGVHHVIAFEAVDDARTEMTVTEYGYASADARDLSKAGLEQCLDKMAAIFAGE